MCFDQVEDDFLADCFALAPVVVLYSFSEALNGLSSYDACFLPQFTKHGGFLTLVGFNVAFYEVPVPSRIPQEKVVYFTVFNEDYGATRFFALHRLSNPCYCLLHSCLNYIKLTLETTLYWAKQF